MRSKLFVPGVRPDLFAKAYSGAADAVSFDLEDAVAPDRKAEARAAVAAFLGSPSASAKQAVVRVNGLDSGWLEADLEAILPTRPALLNLPRMESASAVQAVIALIDRLEAALALPPAPRLLLNIETPRGLREAAAIASAHPRVAGLQLGLGDLFEPYGIARDDPANVRHALFQVAMAAAEAGVFACDGAHPDYTNGDGFRHEAAMARALGFAGKSCIHPNQVAWANAAFTPDPQELAWARRVMDAADQAAQAGKAVFAVDGRMVDAPYLERARRLLDQHAAIERTQDQDA